MAGFETFERGGVSVRRVVRRPPRPSRRPCAARWPSRRCGRFPSRASSRCCARCVVPSANSASDRDGHRRVGDEVEVRGRSRVSLPCGARDPPRFDPVRRPSSIVAPIVASASAKRHVALDARSPDAFDAHRGRRRSRAGRQKIRRRRRVAFDVSSSRRHDMRAGGDRERAPALALDLDAEALHQAQRDLHVRLRDQFAVDFDARALAPTAAALISKRRQELARHVAAHAHRRCARRMRPRMNRERRITRRARR